MILNITRDAVAQPVDTPATTTPQPNNDMIVRVISTAESAPAVESNLRTHVHESLVTIRSTADSPSAVAEPHHGWWSKETAVLARNVRRLTVWLSADSHPLRCYRCERTYIQDARMSREAEHL
jgi:hypothetical protein